MLKKMITALLISSIFCGVMLSACSFLGDNSESQSDSSNASSNSSSSAGNNVNEFYDDGGEYDEKEDTYVYDFDDSVTSKNVYFSNGQREIAFSQYTSDLLVKDGFAFSYVSKQEYQSGNNEIILPENAEEYIKVSCNDTTSYPKFSLRIDPAVSEADFCKADYISFYVYFKDKTSSDLHTSWTNVLELYFSNTNSELLPAKTSEWIEVTLPLSLYKTPMTTSAVLLEVNSLSDLYEYLKEYDLISGEFIKHSGVTLDTCQYDLFITDMRLKIMSVDDTLDRNFTDLSEKDENGAYINTFPNWGQPTEELDADRGWRMMKRYSGGNQYYKKIFVVPQKTEKQLDFYDYVKITMYIDADIKYPFVISSAIPTKLQKIEKTYAKVSANKWVDVFIPIEDVKALYPHLLTSTYFHKHANPIYAIMPFIQCGFVVDGISSLHFSSKNITDFKNAGKISSKTEFSVLIDTIKLVKKA